MQRRGEQSEDKDTDKPDGPELHNGILYCYEGTNITGERVVNDPKTQLNDALIAFRETVGYLMTLSALKSTSGEIVTPICFAVFKLMTKSNFLGHSTGRSAGLLPFKILST